MRVPKQFLKKMPTMTKLLSLPHTLLRQESCAVFCLLRRVFSSLLLLIFALVGLLPAAQGLAAEQKKEIVFLAGPKDHGVAGRHEYEKDLQLLAHALERSANLEELNTKLYVGKAPRDLKSFENAAAIVILSSSDRAADETHPLFPPDPTTDHHGYDEQTSEYLKNLDALIKKNKVGVVIFHYANWVENWAARGYVFDWTGGLWVQMVSRNPNDQWHMQPKNTSHPVLRGVKPWTYKDEVFTRFFLPEDYRRTELLIGNPAESDIGPQVAAWAYQREDGGRGFVMGGVDYHDNMKIDDYRRFLLNGIAWAAGIEVPEHGVDSSLAE